MASALGKPEVLVFDEDLAEQWRVFEFTLKRLTLLLLPVFECQFFSIWQAQKLLDEPEDFKMNRLDLTWLVSRSLLLNLSETLTAYYPNSDSYPMTLGTASEPRSYLVSGGTYRHNRQHILPVNEPAAPPYYPDRTSVLPSVSSGINPPTPAQQPTSAMAALPVATPPPPAPQ